jgi:hypothetical protein
MVGKETVQVVCAFVKAVLAQVEIALPFSLKATVPVGLPAPGLRVSTVAVKVTTPPTAEGLAEEDSALSV